MTFENLAPASALLCAALCATFGATQAAACSDTDPCIVESGNYFVALPEEHDGPIPAVFWIHGYGSSGAAIFRHSDVPDAILSKGYALIGLNGLPRAEGGGNTWSFHPDHPSIPQRRDEIAYITEVRDDAIEQFGLDPDHVILAGFSIGGSMTSYLACAAPETFTAYAPLSGSFWRPHPETCAGPVKLLHTHGWSDGTVPLEGRVLRGGDTRDPDMLAQGDVFHAMEIWRQTNECVHLKADFMRAYDEVWRRAWTSCADGSSLDFALFPGGHIIPNGWAAMMMNWAEDVLNPEG